MNKIRGEAIMNLKNKVLVGVLGLFLALLSASCNLIENFNNTTDENSDFQVSLIQNEVTVFQGGKAYLTLEIDAPSYIGEEVSVKLLDLQQGTPVNGVSLQPPSFVLEKSPFRKELEVSVDESLPQGKYDLQLVVAVNEAEARLLLSLIVSHKEPLEVSALIFPSNVALFQGEKRQVVVDFELNRNLNAGAFSLEFEFSSDLPDVDIELLSLNLDRREAFISLIATPEATPGLYKTDMLAIFHVEDEVSTVSIPISILIVNSAPDWFVVSSLIREVDSCDGSFVAVGDFGGILTSLDGLNWEFYSSPALDLNLSASLDNFKDVACGNNKLVIIGETGRIYVTDLPLTQLSDWKVLDLGESDLRQVEFGGGNFLINAYDQFFISEDAELWEKVEINWKARSLKSIKDSLWLSAGYEYINGTINEVIYESRDVWNSWARRWESEDLIYLGNIVSDGSFAAVLGDKAYLHTPDLANWYVRSYAEGINIKRSCDGVNYEAEGSVWVACGDLYEEQDSGRDWTKVDIDSILQNIAYVDAVYTAIAAPKTGALYVSKGGSAWERSAFKFASASSIEGYEASDLWGIAYGDGLYVVVGREGDLSVSSDGDLWHSIMITDPAYTNVSILWKDVVYSPALRRFVAVGVVGSYTGDIAINKGYVAWADAASWNGRDLDWHVLEFEDMDFNAIGWGGGKFLIAGDDGLLLTSTDGILWRESYPADDQNLYSLASDDSGVVVLSTSKGVLISNDNGNLWQSIELSGLEAGNVCYDGNEFYLFKGNLFTRSRDGLTWTAPLVLETEKGEINSEVANVFCSNGLKVVLTYAYKNSDYTVLASTDGITWKGLLPTRLNYALYDVLYAENTILVVGQQAAVLRAK